MKRLPIAVKITIGVIMALIIINIIAATLIHEGKPSKIINPIVSKRNEDISESVKSPIPQAPKKAIDLTEIKRLVSLFNVKHDEFDNIDWYIPKSAPKFVNQNGIYCYFQKGKNGVSNFRFKIQYNSDDWLFINKYQFSIDGKAYEYEPANWYSDIQRDNGDGGIWEWIDQPLNVSTMPIVMALSDSKEAKIKFIGKQYHKVKIITASQIKSIKDAVDLYLAFNGDL